MLVVYWQCRNRTLWNTESYFLINSLGLSKLIDCYYDLQEVDFLVNILIVEAKAREHCLAYNGGYNEA